MIPSILAALLSVALNTPVHVAAVSQDRLASAAAGTQAQTTFLVPIALGTTPGLFGSSWATELTTSNHGDSAVELRDLPHPQGCPIDICFGYTIGARASLTLTEAGSCPTDGCLAHVDADRAGDLSFALRTRDVSRQSASWGVMVPVVRGDQMFSRTFSITDVPVDPQFRATLRLYDADPTTPPQVMVRVYSVSAVSGRDMPDEFVAEFTPSFSIGYPGLRAAVSQTYLAGLPNLPSTGRIRIEVIPLDNRQDYWGFVSVTNNDTQEVTVIHP